MAKRGLSSVQRTLRACREQGRFVEKLEQWVSHGKPNEPRIPGKPSGTRRDAFGFIDIMAIDLLPHGIVAIQACTSGRKEHYDKIIANEYALAWVQAGGVIELWSWAKHKIVRGGKAERWTPKVERITEADFPQAAVI